MFSGICKTIYYKQNDCEGDQNEVESCERDCIECAQWSQWGECTVTCGIGEQSRAHTCVGVISGSQESR